MSKWTPEEDALLTEALRKKTSIQRLAVRFNKSCSSIKTRAIELGLEVPKPVQAPKEQAESKRWVPSKLKR